MSQGPLLDVFPDYIRADICMNHEQCCKMMTLQSEILQTEKTVNPESITVPQSQRPMNYDWKGL